MLLALVERRKRVVNKHELLDAGWPGMVVEENNVAVQVSSLRRPGDGWPAAVAAADIHPPKPTDRR